jgi:tetratricopeptide (TPR) repeat protein
MKIATRENFILDPMRATLGLLLQPLILVGLTLQPMLPQPGRNVDQVSFSNSVSAATQKIFLHGLAQLHDFEYETAADDFRQAQGIDPTFCMAYWGEAMSYNEPLWGPQNQMAAQAALKKLGNTETERLAKCGTERERDYLRSIDILYFSAGTKYERDFKYLDAMAALYKKYPDDVDAGAFYALAILGTAHFGRDVVIYMRALAVLEPLFFSHSDHPGVNHYLIHCVDDPVHAPLGLAAARNYSKIAIDAPHAQHMTSHIFMALGMWDDVVTANLTAIRIQDERDRRKGRTLESCGHYTSWLEYGYLQQGRFGEAKRVVEKCRDAATAAASSAKPRYIEDIAFYGGMRSRYLLDAEEWNGDVAHWAVSPTSDYQGDIAASFAFADGFSAIRRGDLKAALKAGEALKAADKAENSRPLLPGASPTPRMKRASILRQELDAMIDVAEGSPDQAIAILHDASAKEASIELEYGPPFIDKPADELLGEVLLETGRAYEAQAAFKASLARAPERTQSLVGLSRALKAAGDASSSAAIDEKLQTIWHNADQVPGADH